MSWRVVWYDEETNSPHVFNVHTFYEAFGYFTSAVMSEDDNSVIRCYVWTINSNNEIKGNTPVLAYDNT